MRLEILRLDSLLEEAEGLSHEPHLIPEVRGHVLLQPVHVGEVVSQRDVLVGDVGHGLEQLEHAFAVDLLLRVLNRIRKDVLFHLAELRG